MVQDFSYIIHRQYICGSDLISVLNSEEEYIFYVKATLPSTLIKINKEKKKMHAKDM